MDGDLQWFVWYGREIGMWWAKGYSGIYIKGYMMNG